MRNIKFITNRSAIILRIVFDKLTIDFKRLFILQLIVKLYKYLIS